MMQKLHNWSVGCASTTPHSILAMQQIKLFNSKVSFFHRITQKDCKAEKSSAVQIFLLYSGGRRKHENSPNILNYILLTTNKTKAILHSQFTNEHYKYTRRVNIHFSNIMKMCDGINTVYIRNVNCHIYSSVFVFNSMHSFSFRSTSII